MREVLQNKTTRTECIQEEIEQVECYMEIIFSCEFRRQLIFTWTSLRGQIWRLVVRVYDLNKIFTLIGEGTVYIKDIFP